MAILLLNKHVFFFFFSGFCWRTGEFEKLALISKLNHFALILITVSDKCIYFAYYFVFDVNKLSSNGVK